MSQSANSASVSIRLNAQQRRVIAQAAKVLNVSVKSFVLKSAYDDAQAILAEQASFPLPPAKWEQFVAALDAPPKDIPELRRLLNEPGVFDGD